MPQKQKLSLEEKVKIIQDYLEGTISKSEAARRGGVARDTIEQWARNYESDGEYAFLLHKNRVYSPEIKRQAVEDYLSGVGSQSEICKKYHIRKRMQLQKWIKVYNAHGDFNSTKFSGGGSYMKRGRETTFEERVQIARECIATGKNYGEIALLGRFVLNRWEKRDYKTGVVSARRTKLPVLNWNRRKLRLSSSNTNCIWRKWRMPC